MSGTGALELDHLFRHQSGRLVATLVRILGPDRLTLAEEAVQDALVRALEIWPYHGVPANPAAWLIQVARNRALDEIRRERSFERTRAYLEGLAALDDSAQRDDAPVADDQLRLLFLCCHPAIPRESRVALALRLAGGLSVGEIARAFLSEPATIAQRIVRAKRTIRDQRLPFEMPPLAELRERLAAILESIYLIFSEGSGTSGGDDALRLDFVEEAVRLGRMLALDERFGSPATHALLALMLFHAARLPARMSAQGELLMLDEQDRAKWKADLIREGLGHFNRSIAGEEMTSYHVEAAIAFCHAAASNYEATDWRRIVELYDDLGALTGSPVVALNRAVAIGMAFGPATGLGELDRLDAEPKLQRLAALPAARGELLLRAGRFDEAAACYRGALVLPMNEPERRHIQRKLTRCEELTARAGR